MATSTGDFMRTVLLPGTSESLPVGKVVCVGRNYREHALELGNEVPAEPVLFIKPNSCLIGPGEEIVIPPWSQDCHHEVELALLIGKTGKNVPEEEAMAMIAGYGVAIDLTLRDVQNALKSKGLPWEKAKAFDTSCPLSPFVAADQIVDPQRLRLSLKVNGNLRQDGCTSQMVHRLPGLLAAISTFFTLQRGDVVLTGTPAGVGPIGSGDEIEASIEGVGMLRVRVA
jgi:2-keto-4-pentenoate hydratase/2-oxohepta-3-ene-1,7-dioic acid hydratase in catechol pathway